MKIPRLHPDTIEAVKQRVDIVDIVSDRVVLKRQGKDFAGLCPFHDEKTPSFTVVPTKQMYYCFGCGAGGNAIKFLMETDKQSFGEVVMALAKRYQIPVKTLDPQQHQEVQRQLSLREKLYEILAVTANFYRHALRQPEGSQALAYLREKRELAEETIQGFNLGFAPPGWQTLYHYLVETKNFPVELVERAGVIVPRKGDRTGYYDRFRNRLIVPIADLQGRTIGFGGRTLGDEQPKYLNSPETELFAKGKTLFALDKAKQAISKNDRAIVVEGYFDAIALHAAGIENAVACLGTALNREQIHGLLRYTDSKQIVFNFDADRSGQNAAERAIDEMADLAYQGEVQLRVLTLPDGKDADEFLKASGSPDDYRALIAGAPLWIDWQIGQIVGDEDLTQGDRFQKVSQGLDELLCCIGDKNLRAHYTRRCAEILSRGDARLVPTLVESLTGSQRKSRRKPKTRNDRTEASTLSLPAENELLDRAEATLLRVFIHCPEARSSVRQAAKHLERKGVAFSLSDYRFLWQQVLRLERDRSQNFVADLQAACAEFPQPMERISHLLYLTEALQRDMERLPAVVRGAALAIEQVQSQKRLRYLQGRWEATCVKTNPQAAKKLSEMMRQETNYLQELQRSRSVSLPDEVSFGEGFANSASEPAADKDTDRPNQKIVAARSEPDF